MTDVGAPIDDSLDLVYTTDRIPGLRRRRCGRGFAYYRPDGTLLRDAAERRRINALAIPPAYEDVWICPLPNGHLQATGRDARGRKQYRYHPRWHDWTTTRKFASTVEFGRALPAVRKAVLHELAHGGMGKPRVLAALVRLLDRTALRVGNPAYREENDTYGLTTLTGDHVDLDGPAIHLAYMGKNSEPIEVTIRHPTIARILRRLQGLPGQQLFQFRDATGWHPLDSADVNQWLKAVGEGDFTAKDFRTWHATRLAAEYLGAAPPPTEERALASARLEGIRATARLLNHRATVCRKHYIHPAILDAYEGGRLYPLMQGEPHRREGPPWALSPSEAKVLRLLDGD